jgi:hypothetical protein
MCCGTHWMVTGASLPLGASSFSLVGAWERPRWISPVLASVSMLERAAAQDLASDGQHHNSKIKPD